MHVFIIGRFNYLTTASLRYRWSSAENSDVRKRLVMVVWNSAVALAMSAIECRRCDDVLIGDLYQSRRVSEESSFFFQFHTRSCWSPSFSDSRLILVDKICALWGIPPLSWHIRFSTVRSQSGADHSFSWEFFLTHSRILILHIIFLSYTPSFSSSISLISLRSPLPDRKVLRKGR